MFFKELNSGPIIIRKCEYIFNFEEGILKLFMSRIG